MSPTFTFLLGLVALIPFPLSVPARPAGGVSLSPSLNPLPPSPGGWYDIPGTTLSIHAVEPYGPALPSLPNAIAAVSAAKSAIDASQRPTTQLPHRPRSWQTSSSQVQLSAASVFSHLGNYGQLSSALTGLEYILSTPGQVGAKEFTWAVSDDTLGVIILGDIKAVTARERTLLSGTAANATKTTNGEGGNTTESSGTRTGAAASAESSGTGTGVAASAEPKVSIASFRLLSDETD